MRLLSSACWRWVAVRSPPPAARAQAPPVDEDRGQEPRGPRRPGQAAQPPDDKKMTGTINVIRGMDTPVTVMTKRPNLLFSRR